MRHHLRIRETGTLLHGVLKLLLLVPAEPISNVNAWNPLSPVDTSVSHIDSLRWMIQLVAAEILSDKLLLVEWNLELRLQLAHG